MCSTVVLRALILSEFDYEKKLVLIKVNKVYKVQIKTNKSAQLMDESSVTFFFVFEKKKRYLCH